MTLPQCDGESKREKSTKTRLDVLLDEVGSTTLFLFFFLQRIDGIHGWRADGWITRFAYDYDHEMR